MNIRLKLLKFFLALGITVCSGTSAWAANVLYSDVQTIFNNKCVGCHGGSAGLSLASPSYANLVMTASSESPSILRVKPFDSANSELVQKINPAGSMTSFLLAAETTTITNWVNQGASTSYTVGSSNNSPVVGSNVTITAQLKDLNGNNVNLPNVTVNWSHSGGGNFSSSTSNTVGNGSATVTFTVDTSAGVAQTVSGTTSATTGTSASITPVAGPASKYLVSSSVGTPGPGSTVTITAQLADSNDNHVSTPAQTITWSSTNGGSFGSPTSQTNASGTATVSFKVSGIVGTLHLITATDNNNFTGAINVTVNAHGTDALVSAKPNGSVSATGTGSSEALPGVLSTDGRFIVFISDATDLTSIADTNTKNDLFYRDQQTGTTSLVSINAGGTAACSAGVSISTPPALSGNGRYVAFASTSTDLVSPSPSAFQHIYRRDMQTGQTILVSVSNGNISGDNNSDTPVISADGRFIAFTSTSTNLAATDTNAKTDVFLRDCQQNTTSLVSINSAGTNSGNSDSTFPVISADGRYVAFMSNASDLVSGDSNGSSDIFRRDMQVNGAGSTVMVSAINGGTTPGNGAAANPSINSTGQFVTFDSAASNLVTGDSNGLGDIFRRDCNTNTTIVVTAIDGTSTPGSGSSDTGPAPMSANGQFVLFTSNKTNLVSGPSSNSQDIFRRDCNANATVLVSAVNGSTAPGAGGHANIGQISDDGRFATFDSSYTNLVSGAVTLAFHIYRRDINLNTTTLLDVSSAGGSGNGDSQIAAMSGDGTQVVFNSNASNLISNDNNLNQDVFSISVNTAPTVAAGSAASISEGGTFQQNGTFSDPDSEDTFTATVDYGDGSGVQALTLAGTTFSLNHVYTDTGSYSATVDVTDNHGAVGQGMVAVTVVNVSPTVAITGAPASPATGVAVNLALTVTDPGIHDTFTYAWNVTKDGAAFASGTNATFGFTPNGKGSYAVTVTVTDKDGGTGTASVTLAVPNTNPTVSITGLPASAAAGTQITLSATVTDPDTGDTATYAWSATKAGVSFATGTNATFSFIPDTAANYTVGLTVTDSSSGTGSDSKTITVSAAGSGGGGGGGGGTGGGGGGSNAPLNNQALAGSPITLSVVAPAGDTISWNFGDGSPADNSNSSTLTHTYTTPGTYTVTVTETDAAGNQTVVTIPVTIVSSNSYLDSDGDGFSNELETALGSLPNDPTSTPFNIPDPVTPQALTLTKISIKLNFAKTGADSITVSGTLPVPAGFNPTGTHAAVDVGGAIEPFLLDKHGSGKTGKNTFKAVIPKKGVTAKFQCTLKGSLAAALTDEMLTGDQNLKGVPRTVVVNVIFNQTLFQTPRAVTYTAKAKKTGSAK